MLWLKVVTTHHLTFRKEISFSFFSNIGYSYKKVAKWLLNPTLKWYLVTCVEQLVKHGGSWSLGCSFCGKKFKAILSQPHFGLSVRVKPTLPKVGSWSPSGLPKTQSAIAGVKYPRIWALLVSLERSWSVDVQNGLAWAIWTSTAQVMGKRRAGSQTGSLTPDH